MDRRSVLRIAALGVPAAGLLAAVPAWAAADYEVAVCEQYHNQIQIYPSGSAWGPDTLRWSFSPGTANGWSNLSEVKFRNTAQFGEVALVAASGGRLWALGQGRATPFTVTGTYRDTRLVAADGDVSIGAGNLGHSLDASYADSGILLASHGAGVVAIDKATHAVTPVSSAGAVKSYSRHASGESLWVQATGKTYHGDTRNWVNPAVQFFDASGAKSVTRSLTYGAEFYKARLHATAFH